MLAAEFEQLSELGNGRIAHHTGRSDAAIRRCWQEWVDNGRFQLYYGSGGLKATADWENKLIVRSVVTAPDSSLYATLSHLNIDPMDF
ncbi:UNVERIFIED_CONTAM: hypothetical protein NCL1_21533 [Trichonephila clavipes]